LFVVIEVSALVALKAGEGRKQAPHACEIDGDACFLRLSLAKYRGIDEQKFTRCVGLRNIVDEYGATGILR